MRPNKEPSSRGGSIAAAAGKIVIGAALTLFLAWQVVKTSAADALMRRNLPAALAIAPDHPAVRINLASAEFHARGGVLSPASRNALLDATKRAPLAEEPFFLEGVAAIAAGDPDRGERLLEEARRRNPRSRGTRLILLDRYLRKQQIERAGVEIAALSRLMPRSAEVLIPELARMVREPKSGAGLIRVLQSEPALQQGVLSRLAQTDADPDLILRIAAATPAPAAGSEPPPWQRELLARLIGKNDLTRAYALWRSFAGAAAGEAGGQKGLYDGRFQALPGPPPFNWQLLSGPEGVAERSKAPALDVEYYGRANVELASQLLLLSPGRYRLQFSAQGAASGEGSQIVWSVTCHNSKARLLNLPLTGITASPKIAAGEFTVPSGGCSGQWLRLAGVAGEFSGGQTATISDMAISRAGAR
ncbi:MAG TPA: hypothetical protein VGC35_10280 [Allosphingosinicella sp.]